MISKSKAFRCVVSLCPSDFFNSLYSITLPFFIYCFEFALDYAWCIKAIDCVYMFVFCIVVSFSGFWLSITLIKSRVIDFHYYINSLLLLSIDRICKSRDSVFFLSFFSFFFFSFCIRLLLLSYCTVWAQSVFVLLIKILIKRISMPQFLPFWSTLFNSFSIMFYSTRCNNSNPNLFFSFINLIGYLFYFCFLALFYFFSIFKISFWNPLYMQRCIQVIMLKFIIFLHI